MVETRRLFEEAAAPHRVEVRRSDPEAAIAAVSQMIVGACIHYAVSTRTAGETGVSWEAYADQLSDMAVAYLLSPERPRRPQS